MLGAAGALVAAAGLPGCGWGAQVSGPPRRRGVSAAGADFAVGARFDSDESFAFYAGRGHTLVRLPFLWESVQPEPGRPLDGDYADALVAAVGSCTRRGMACVLDVHSYARHRERVVGGGEVDAADLADLWVRLVDRVGDDPLVELGLMNEPHDVPGGPPAWEDVVQEVVTAVRGAGSTQRIWVPGEQWSSAASWAGAHPRWWVEDPLDLSGPEGHYYLDAGNQRRGTYPHPYDVDDDAARAEGFEDLHDKVRTELSSFVRYCEDQGVQGFLGEIGWPGDGPAAAHPEDAPRWAELGETAYAVLDEAGLDAACWAAGEQWGEDYALSVYTGTPQQTPTVVAEVVERHPTVD